MRDEKGRAFSLKESEKQYATQRLGGGMISDEQIISVSASKITGGDVPGAGTLENALTIRESGKDDIVFDGAQPETITIPIVEQSLSNSSLNAISNKAVTLALADKAPNSGSAPNLTVGVANKTKSPLTFTGASTGTFDGSVALSINIPEAPTVPTKTSELTNDSGFLTSVPAEYVTDTELTAKGYQTSSDVSGAITTALTPYLKSADADTTYVKTADLTDAINSAITAALANYYTKTEADARFEPKTTV